MPLEGNVMRFLQSLLILILLTSSAYANPAAKVEVCHVLLGDASHTILVASASVDTYLTNNPTDTLGPCVDPDCLEGVVAVSEAPGFNCPDGGASFSVCTGGVTSVTYACNGAIGYTGSQGSQGIQGDVGPQGIQGLPGIDAPFFSMNPVPPGHPVCATGGTEFVVGQNVSYACNGYDGDDGTNGFDGATGPQGMCSCELECAPGTADCDENWGTGCETDTTILTDCGGCGITCSGSEACFESACCDPVDSCPPGVCGTTADDGCGGTITCAPCLCEGGEVVFSSVHSTAYHICGLKLDGSVVCWGSSDASGKISKANADTGTYTSVQAGGNHTCAQKSDRTMICWGNDWDEQVFGPDNFGVYQYFDIAIGGSLSCGVHDKYLSYVGYGRVECWGSSSKGQRGIEQAGEFTKVYATGYHTCGINRAGEFNCWGIDDGSTSDVGQVTGPNAYTGADIVTASINNYTTCGLRSNGSIICWGADSGGSHDYGQVSGPNNSGLSGFKAVSAGYYHTCVVKDTGSLLCWGADGGVASSATGQVSGPNEDSATDYVFVTAGIDHTCGMHTDGTLTCWGSSSITTIPGCSAL